MKTLKLFQPCITAFAEDILKNVGNKQIFGPVVYHRRKNIL